MSLSRRDLLKITMKAGAGAAVLSGIPGPLLAQLGGVLPESVQSIRDPMIKELALRAVEAARGAGASYVDVRLTRTRQFGYGGRIEGLVVGVRSLVNGYWGFSSGRLWTPDEVARLGRESVGQARALAIGPVREVDLAAVPTPVDEHWTMPVEIDPFEEVSEEEVSDFLGGLKYFIEAHPNFEVPSSPLATFVVQEKAFASSEGAYCTQRLHRSSGAVVLRLKKNGRELSRGLDTLTPAGLGWELFKGQPIREQIRRLMDEMEEDFAMPVKPVEVGRYDVVCDARTIVNLVESTLGTATQLDRALGFEANASGTSYLNAPLEMLGSFEVGAPLLTLTANRSEQGGAATVAWDDEGVRPDEFALVREGVLQDFQTTRESAAWLAGNTKASREIRSNGCATAPTAVEAPLTHTPNLRVAPGSEAVDFDDLVSGIEEGLAVKDMDVSMDFQGLNGMGQGRVYEVKDGKRVAIVAGAGFLFRAPELWKRLVALGGEASMRRYGMASSKGEPEQTTYHSVSAPPAVFEEFTVIDPRRKA